MRELRELALGPPTWNYQAMKQEKKASLELANNADSGLGAQEAEGFGRVAADEKFVPDSKAIGERLGCPQNQKTRLIINIINKETEEPSDRLVDEGIINLDGETRGLDSPKHQSEAWRDETRKDLPLPQNFLWDNSEKLTPVQDAPQAAQPQEQKTRSGLNSENAADVSKLSTEEVDKFLTPILSSNEKKSLGCIEDIHGCANLAKETSDHTIKLLTKALFNPEAEEDDNKDNAEFSKFINGHEIVAYADSNILKQFEEVFKSTLRSAKKNLLNRKLNLLRKNI